MLLSGKAAVVTGSTSGIGLGVARALASAGANILLNGFGDRSTIDAVREEIESEFKVRVATAAPI
jgi:3-hydroxybutyrate dehydrogenase